MLLFGLGFLHLCSFYPSVIQLYEKGIKVTVVCPGPIKTQSTPEVGTSSEENTLEVCIATENNRF